MDTLRQSPVTAGSLDFSARSRSIRAFEWDRAFTLLLSDLAMLGIASCMAAVCISYVSQSLDYTRVAETALIWTVASVCTFKLLGLYRISYALDSRDEWYYVIVGLVFGGAPALLIFTVIPALSSSRLVLLLSIVFSALLVGLSRQLIHFRYLTSARQRRVALVATPAELPQIARAMEDGSNQVSFVPVNGTEEAIDNVLDGSGFSWYDRLLEQGCDEIVFAGMPTARTAFLVERAARDHVAIGFAPAGLSLQPCRLDFVTSLRQPILVARRAAACTQYNRLLKRMFDLVVATIGLLLTCPIMVGAMIAILVESGGPVIFRQTRVGRDGKPFEILKLRSMTRDAEARCGPVWAVGDPAKDPRTTKVGAFIRKTSIDELPQFINVLLGEMSIVGPRPERPAFVEQFRERYSRYDERHLVRPGITGWAHIHMRRSPDMEELAERLDLDLFYVENYSLLLDVCITFKTAVEVLFQRWT
jgi:exopolysaccharide biosynthesis polyprenyl glycosylphosphotransferase